MTEECETVADTSDAEDTDGIRDHLSDVDAGAGCTEIWAHLSENRAAEEQD